MLPIVTPGGITRRPAAVRRGADEEDFVSKRVRGALIAGLSATTAALALAGAAQAAPPDCSSLPNPVYLQVGDTQEPLMKALGQKLRASQINPITIIYKTSGSCTNID